MAILHHVLSCPRIKFFHLFFNTIQIFLAWTERTVVHPLQKCCSNRMGQLEDAGPMQRAESCCVTVSTETVYAGQQYDAPGKCAREVVDRRGGLARAIDYCVWHVWGCGGPAQHHHGFWDRCTDCAVGHDCLPYCPRDTHAGHGLAHWPVRPAQSLCAGSAWHHADDGTLRPLLEYRVSHCLLHCAGLRGGFSDEHRYGYALRSLPHRAARSGYGGCLLWWRPLDLPWGSP